MCFFTSLTTILVPANSTALPVAEVKPNIMIGSAASMEERRPNQLDTELEEDLGLLSSHRPTVDHSDSYLELVPMSYQLHCPQDTDDLSTLPSEIEPRRGQNGLKRMRKFIR